jgi:leucyl-tRNA synthetase
MEFLKKIEEKWQKRWEEAKIFEADPNPEKPKYFITVAYPYPNSPQHIGHARTYTLADVHARYMRMRGYNVLLPMAFHYTGTPVLAMSKRLAENDEDLINDFVNVYKVPREKLKEFTDPLIMARYFHEEIREGMRKIGYSIDWRREFTTIDSYYNRFIEWQFNKLRQKGYITRGSHPVGWCPKDGNPVGQHDTIGDVEPEIGEFILIKFKQVKTIFPTATLRPETVFGVTNLWVNPQARYVKAKVDNEEWVISQESIEKLLNQNRKVQVLESFLGKRLIGTFVESPVNQAKIVILPADFVDPKNATGIVMSVPGHAPYDYVALENIKKEHEKLKKYGLKPEKIEQIKPISLIAVPGYSEIPAADVVKKMKITEQTDPKLEDATKEVYRHEFHNGKMKTNTGKYYGMSVAQAKEEVKQDLVAEGKATTMYELVNRPVKCRCGEECIVKILQDQWFIDYGKPEWKTLAHKCLNKMEILPEELRTEFEYVIDWLHEKACARKSGMGTKLPWDKEWIIESLSDSTIYMAYYTIARHLKKCQIRPEQMTDEVFDYIFLGEGSIYKVAEKVDLNTEILERMRQEFLYFYPLDSRHSGRDLIHNHLTFMIFNHIAIFPEKLWPRQIVTNGSVMMEGVKMSKSFGNIIPLQEGLEKFGADPVRLSVLSTVELLQDAEFNPHIAKSMIDKLEKLYRFAIQTTKIRNKENGKGQVEAFDLVDKWMLSRLQRRITDATEAMEKMSVRKAIHCILYELDQDLRWYQKRTANRKQKEDSVKKNVLRQVLETQILMLAPVAPHICEEIWEMIGKKGFISTSPWPKPNLEKIDIKAEESEELLINLLEDTENIIKVTKTKPRKIFFYVASAWKWKVYLKALEKSMQGKIELKELIQNALKVGRKPKEVIKFATKVIEQIKTIPEKKKRNLIKIRGVDERKIIEDAKEFLRGRLQADITVYVERDRGIYDPKRKAAMAMPLRPAIYIE